MPPPTVGGPDGGRWSGAAAAGSPVAPVALVELGVVREADRAAGWATDEHAAEPAGALAEGLYGLHRDAVMAVLDPLEGDRDVDPHAGTTSPSISRYSTASSSGTSGHPTSIVSR